MAVKYNFTNTPKGIVVTLGKNTTLPGVFTNELYAQKAVDRYTNSMKSARQQRRKVTTNA